MLAVEKLVWREKIRLTSSVRTTVTSKAWRDSARAFFSFSIKEKTKGSSAHRVLEKLRTTQWKFGGNPGGVRTTIAMHCGCKIFKIAAEVEKFRRLYALFFNRYSSFLRSFFSISQANICLDFFCEEKQIFILHFNLKREARRFLL